MHIALVNTASPFFFGRIGFAVGLKKSEEIACKVNVITITIMLHKLLQNFTHITVLL